MAIGRKGFYATDAPLQDYVGNAIQQNVDNSFKFRAEQRLQEEQKKAKDDANLEELAKYNTTFKTDLTGQAAIDYANLEYAKNTQNQFYENFKISKDATRPLEERQKAQAAMTTLMSSFQTTAQVPKMINAAVKDWATNIDKYDRKDIDEKQKFLGAIEQGNYKINNINGVPTYTIYEKDDSGKVTGVIAKDMYAGDLQQKLQPIQKSNYQETLLKETEKYKVNMTETEKNGLVIKDGRVDASPGSRDYQNADSFAQMIVAMPNERKILSRDLGVAEDKLQETIRQDYLNNLQSNYTQSKNYEEERLRQQRAELNRNLKKDAKEDIIPIARTVTTQKNETKLNGVTIPIGSKIIPFDNLINGDPKKSYDQATHFTVKRGSDGQFKVFGHIQNVGGETISVSEKVYSESGKEKIAYNKANKKEITAGKKQGKVLNDDTDILSTVTSQKQKPPRVIDFGNDAKSIAPYASKFNMTVAEFTDDLIRKAGYDPMSDPKRKPKVQPKSTKNKQSGDLDNI
jgi:hypothetical protein